MSNTELAHKDEVPIRTQDAWLMLENLLSRQYLQSINQTPVVIRQDSITEVLKTVRADRITRILYDRAEDNLTKFNSIFTALYSSGSTVFILLNSNKQKTEIFMGVKSDSAESADASIKTLEKSLNGNFPGMTIEEYTQTGSLSDYLRKGNYTACVSGVPSLKSDTPEDFFQGLEKIIDAMGDSTYTALFLATPVSREKLNYVERAYQDIYSCLSLLNIDQLSLSEQESVSLGENINQTLTQAISSSVARANTYTMSKSTSRSLTKTNSTGVTDSKAHTKTDTLSRSSTDTKSRAESLTTSHAHSESTTLTKSTNVGGSMGTFAGGGVSIAPFGIGGNIFGGVNKSINASVGLAHATTSGTTDTVSKGLTNTDAHSDTSGKSVSDAETLGRSNTHTVGIGTGTTDGSSVAEAQGKIETDALTESAALSKGKQKTLSLSNSKSYTYAVTDKHVTESLVRIDEQLARIRTARNYGAWNWAGYFIADDPVTARNGADIYTGILSGEQTGTERTSVSLWDDKESREIKAVKQSLARFDHPVFRINDFDFNATSLISTPEVAVAMSLPQKSLPGIPVYESTQFGRAVIPFDVDHTDHRLCRIGKVSHLDSVTNEIVRLNFDSLTSHTFITGSTGSGKSNAVNQLLSSLRNPEYDDPKAKEEPRVHFLVIEPAKGEYKDIWNAIRQCNIFGTNPDITPLLKINPFSFPDGIHVMEHIDRLVEILNAVWPMYAAMPAILKDAIEKTYRECGWNLATSKNLYSPVLFPDFHDLQKILPIVIKSSQYSAETKGNYAGALITRIHSLTNGYYRFIFQKEELSAETLFDQNTIVDLSRVGSTETKSLLMGMIFLKLQEYRMSQKNGPNQKLRHVTVLEEAHNLLRKTSMEQSSETANLQGKSVEMLTNAIAEMRTYGEGFIIADQAPGLLDPAVIRNTNTKIVFRLPDYDDRQLVGKSQHLSEEQITELARLRTGCAAVYQNNWQEAVLCQFDRFDKSNISGTGVSVKSKKAAPHENVVDSRTFAEALMLKYLLKEFEGKNSPIARADKEKLAAYYPAYVLQYGQHSEFQTLWLIDKTFVKDAIDDMPTRSPNRSRWIYQLKNRLLQDERMQGLSSRETKLLFCATFRILAEYATTPKEKECWSSYAQNAMKELNK